ncbi:patatin-like phospholipase family protein [Nostoc sp. FACHB-110]|uniref:patatin-like phospholipase family protein n=1 Tax=Nostoc sp. FACHB-110 TaxID=2692834 RepID=UPI001688ABA1|nr:patatin-like phospholipase family protein [Nostoc sp. FACHB-110]MBD2440957.1 patatin-like phospholipase family protein [Nostoc sp. FACHB-110]
MIKISKLSSPSAIEYQDKLYCFYQKEGSNGELWYKVFDGSKWEKDERVDIIGMSCSPSVVVFKGKLYCFNQGRGNNGELWYSVFDGSKWQQDKQVNGVGMSCSPSLVVFKEKLYCFHQGRGNNGELWFSIFDGSKWQQDKHIETVGMSFSPSVVVFKEKLYCFHQGKGNNGELWFSVLDGSKWQQDKHIETVGMSCSPSLVVFKEKLYCFHQGKGNNRQLRYSVFNGSKWESTNLKVNNVGMSSSPSAIVFKDHLCCFHKGIGDDEKLWFSVYDHGKWILDEKAVFGISFRFRQKNPRPQDTKAYPIRILSIDGGGIRGIIPLKVLEYIEKETRKPICELFNYIGGTSTGGIIALGLNTIKPKEPKETIEKVYKAEELMKFYTEDANKIFQLNPVPILAQLENLPFVNFVATGFKGLFVSKYTSEGIENYLKDKFGEKRLLDLPTVRDCDVTVYSYDLPENQPFYFNNRDYQNGRYFVWQAARATSAAPTFFPAFELKNGEDSSLLLIDGGVYINNPALNLLLKARKELPHIKKKNQLLVSLGTGQFSQPKNDLEGKGQLNWAGNIFDVTSMGTSAEIENQIRDLLEYVDPKINHDEKDYQTRYYRFQQRFKEDIPMDGISYEQIKRIEELGEELVEDNQEQLNELCEILVEPIEITPDSIKEGVDYDN